MHRERCLYVTHKAAHIHTQHACMQLPGLPSFLVRGWSDSVLFPVVAPIVTHCKGLNTRCLSFLLLASSVALSPVHLPPHRSPLSLSCLLSLIIMALYSPSLFITSKLSSIYLQHLLPVLRHHFNRNHLFRMTEKTRLNARSINTVSEKLYVLWVCLKRTTFFLLYCKIQREISNII